MPEYITTRTYFSKKLDDQTLSELKLIAKKLGILRKIIWHQFLSNPKKLNDREIRDQWLSARNNKTNSYPKIIDQIPARLWKETLRDTIGNINAYFEAGFTEAIKILYKKYGKEKGKTLAKQLKIDYKMNNELHRLIRKLVPKGCSNANNIICLDEDCYSFKDDQTNIIQVMGLRPMKRLAIPLTTKNRPKGNFKIILKDDRCELRVNNKYQVVANILKDHKAIGVDKGYSEVFTDNTGERHGNNFGKLLTKKSDFLDQKYKNRNKLWAIMKKAIEAGDIKKANNIKFNNLGNKKLNKQKEIMRAELKEKIYSAAKTVAQKASIIAIEDLTFQGKKTKIKKVNRRLSSWIKGVIDEAIIKYCFIYGTKLVYVNAAYTSQGDSRFNCALMGTRIGDSFIGFDEVVLDADINAAINILARLYDSEINLYTSAEKVKEILTKRANAVLSASVETAQLGLQQVVPINLELPAKSGLSKRLNKNLTKVS